MTHARNAHKKPAGQAAASSARIDVGKCRDCGHESSIADALGGKRPRCPACGGILDKVDATQAEEKANREGAKNAKESMAIKTPYVGAFQIYCKRCDAILVYDETECGQTKMCCYCRKRITFPSLADSLASRERIPK